MILLLDSNLLIARFDSTDPHHARSAPLVTRALAGEFDTVAPALILVEVAAGLVRRTGDPNYAREMYEALLNHPQMTWLDMTLESATAAAEFAISTKTRGGSDAMIACFAMTHDIPLVTLDGRLRDAVISRVKVLWPEEALTG